MHPDYPPPITFCNTTGTGVQPDILDIGAFFTPGYPPVIELLITNTATVLIYGALDITQSATPTLVNPIDVTGGGFTASDFYDLIPGIRYYQINVTANTGTVIVKAGFGPQVPGNVGLPQLLRMTNAATQGM